MTMDNSTLVSHYKETFQSEPDCVVHAPGRVNLIGEHTDYNEGFVFPAAINFGTWIAAGKRNDDKVMVSALDYDNQVNTFSLSDIQFDNNQGWANYIRGVVKVLQADFPQIGGA